ncbi:hypothetical protein D3C83_42450 [compost metagenome]
MAIVAAFDCVRPLVAVPSTVMYFTSTGELAGADSETTNVAAVFPVSPSTTDTSPIDSVDGDANALTSSRFPVCVTPAIDGVATPRPRMALRTSAADAAGCADL